MNENYGKINEKASNSLKYMINALNWDLKIKEIEKKISDENNFNDKMKLNIKAHKFKEKREMLINELKGE